ncbi:MAG: MarR family winged helix-turn-helix transcriptional regulator [Vicinamibacterales bacterium]
MPQEPRPSFDPPPLEQRIATGLHKLGLALKHQEWSDASDHKLSPTQGQILAALAAEGALSASEVSTRLGIGLATISEAVTTLAAKGLLRRTPDPRHPRARLLHLTASGRRRAAHARAWPEFLTSAVGTLTADEQTTLLQALMKMIRTLQEQGQIPVQRMCVSCTHFRPHVHDGDQPHHCAFVDAPLGPSALRLDCRDHAAATPEQQQVHWARFIATP